MKIKHTIEISALDLALILKGKMSIKAHHSDLDLEVVGRDAGGFSAPSKPLEHLKITWTEDTAGDEAYWGPER